jgi:ATP-binding cassette, subfamily B, bacterial MsbA
MTGAPDANTTAKSNSTQASGAPPAVSSAAVYRRLLRYLRPEWWAFIVAILGFAVFGWANAYFAKLVAIIITSLSSATAVSSSERLLIPLTVIGVVVARGIGGFIGSYCMSLLAFRIIHRLRSEVVQRFLQLPFKFYDRQSSGQLISAVTFNVAQISGAVSDAIAVLIRENLTIVWLVWTMLQINWKLTLIFVAITPLIGIVVVFASSKLRKHSKRIQGSMGDVTHILSETLKGLKVIRTFGAEAQQAQRFVALSQLNTKQNLKLAVTSAISSPIIQTLVGCAFAFLMWLALAPQETSTVSPQEFIAFLTAAGMLFKPVRQTSKVNADIQKGLAAASSIFALLDEKAEADTGTLSVERVAGKIEFRHVRFAYQGVPNQGASNQGALNQDASESVLHDVSLVCEPGQTVAIVGHSGSGKTTLVNLLPRFYDISSGDILLDGRPLRNYHLNNLRQQMALVSQQVVLFNGTIRDNVAYGELKGTTDAQVIAALERANAMEFVQHLPAGLDTLVGDDGLLLSGGQRQRLAIARALLKNAPILILDEATSALDSASERHIQSALQNVMQGRTTLVIAHRLSTIENADLIVVMDKGSIVDSGTHQQLLALGGAYATLHGLQFADVASEKMASD